MEKEAKINPEAKIKLDMLKAIIAHALTGDVESFHRAYSQQSAFAHSIKSGRSRGSSAVFAGYIANSYARARARAKRRR